MGGLLIVKTDEITGAPLAGAVFDVRRADGQFVAGNILDDNQPNTPNNSPNRSSSPNGDITGSFTTDANGRIQINGLAAGQYMVTERTAPDGYERDTNVYNVTVTPGKMTTLQLTFPQEDTQSEKRAPHPVIISTTRREQLNLYAVELRR